MAVEGSLSICDRTNEGTIKWLLWGDAQTRLDLAWSVWVLDTELCEAPGFHRAMQIIQENNMAGFGPVEDTDPRFLGEKFWHACFIHPKYTDRELAQMPRMMGTIPTG